MFQWISSVFSSSGFMPHIHCYLDRPALVWTMFTTDMLIGVSYFAISLMLLSLLRQTRTKFGPMAACFGVFIGACGLTHFLEVWTLWFPNYWVAAMAKVATAAASVISAAYLYRLRDPIVRVARAVKVTEARRLELEALTQSLGSAVAERTSELDSFFAVAPVGLVQVDVVSRRFLRVNQAFCEIFGYSAAELLEGTIDQITPEEDREADQRRYHAFLASGSTEIAYEKRYRRKDGTYLWGYLRFRIAKDESGLSERGVAAIQDITSRKATDLMLRERQAELERSELRYRTLTEALPQLVWTCLPNGQCDYLSRQWVEYTGMSMSEQLGLDWLEKVIHPDDRVRTYEHWMGAVAGRHGYDIEYRLRRHDGTFRWFKTRGTAARNSEGQIVYWTGSCTDIEEQKRTELELERSRAQFESISNNIPQLAWMTEPDGSIYWYNQNWYDYTGTTPDEMQGWGWRAVQHPDHVDRVTTTWREHLRSGEPWEDVFPLRSASGEWRWFLSRARATRDASGKILHWLGTNTDVTEQRTAREALVRANKGKDELLLLCSHELRTPVAAMKLAADVALRKAQGNAPAEQALPSLVRMAQQSEVQLRRLNFLIDEMLEFSQINSGQLAVRAERFDLRGLVSEVVRYLAPDFEKQKCEPVADLGTEPVTGDWDRLRLRHAIANLLSNALKYGEGRPVTVSLVAKEGAAYLSFRDRGVGIAPSDQERIFLAYERAVPVYNISGLGLGLFIASAIARAHGGEISLESELGAGATFTLRLPL